MYERFITELNTVQRTVRVHQTSFFLMEAHTWLRDFVLLQQGREVSGKIWGKLFWSRGILVTRDAGSWPDSDDLCITTGEIRPADRHVWAYPHHHMNGATRGLS